MSGVSHPGLDNVVSLYDHRQRHDKSNATASTIDYMQSVGFNRNALLIPFADGLSYSASVEIDLLPWIESSSIRVRSQILVAVRKLLHHEFGTKRVSRDHWIFSVQHQDVDTLIAGLLRVQFYAKQLTLPDDQALPDTSGISGVTMTWGVGRTTDEAVSERRKRRHQKNLRR